MNLNVAKLFAKDLNEGIDIATVSIGSSKRYWWRCKRGHVWQARVDGMAKPGRKERCPYCSGRKPLAGFNDIETLAPEAAALWHPTRNGDLRPSDVTTVTHKRFWWKCECGYEWQADPRSATGGKRCPCCSNKVVVAGKNDLATLEPELAKQWHPTLNGGLKPTDVVCGANRRVWWQCPKGHEWQQSMIYRTKRDTGCPICSGYLAAAGVNDLATTHPELAAEWAEDLNGELEPTDVTAISDKYVWWRCWHGHAWQMRVRNRVNRDAGCPYCKNRKLLRGFNEIATLRPDMAAQWYYAGNWPLKPTDLTPASDKRVWWQADCGHVFTSKVRQRAANKKLVCPYCTGYKKPERPMR